jgi:hypothetical protein
LEKGGRCCTPPRSHPDFNEFQCKNACFRSLSLGAKDFENIQELDVQDFEQQQTGEQGK